MSKRTVELGQIVQTGQPLLALVPLHEVWVVANFKETQLARVHPGQRAEITVDGLPGKKFVGTVNSISAGTGARFSLLPPENATGNWVKVVQRIPVKILLDEREIGNPQPLRAGMSVSASIDIGGASAPPPDRKETARMAADSRPLVVVAGPIHADGAPCSRARRAW